MSKKAAGEGTIYRRKDGRWTGALYVDTTSGRRKRVYVYGSTRREAHDKLVEKLQEVRRGIRTPDHAWTVAKYLDYWLDAVVKVKNRPSTFELYEGVARLYLKPAIGKVQLTKLTIRQVQLMINDALERGTSTRLVHLMRSVLRSALSRAEREDLLSRNVAKLVELPKWEPKDAEPWSATQAMVFLSAARQHQWFLIYFMLLLYGARIGEVLGLRWSDIDFAENRFRIKQHLQRIGHDLIVGPVKTSAGRRPLPLVASVRRLLTEAYLSRYGRPGQPDSTAPMQADLVFVTRNGKPIDANTVLRAFYRMSAECGLPRITLHYTRHTSATLLKDIGVPDRDAQLILGHAHVTTTQQLYQHASRKGHLEALTKAAEQLIDSSDEDALLSMPAAEAEPSAFVRAAFSQEDASHNIKPADVKGGLRGRCSNQLSYRPIVQQRPNIAETSEIASPNLPTPEVDTAVISQQPANPALANVLHLCSTPVRRQLKAHTDAHIIGHAAVKHSCQLSRGIEDSSASWIIVRRELRRTTIQTLRHRSFPLCLLPSEADHRPPTAI